MVNGPAGECAEAHIRADELASETEMIEVVREAIALAAEWDGVCLSIADTSAKEAEGVSPLAGAGNLVLAWTELVSVRKDGWLLL